MNGHALNEGNGQRPRLRLPTVDEALQFSPLTSIVPFTSDILCFPNVGSTTLPALPLSTGDLELAKRTLDILNSEALGSQPSSQLRGVLASLQHVLSSVNPTQIKFRLPPLAQQSFPPNASSRPSPQTALDPFARVFFQSTRTPYRYPDTFQPEPRSQINGIVASRGVSTSIKKPTNNQVIAHNHTAHPPSVVSPVLPTTHGKQQAPPASIVVIPKLPTPLHPALIQNSSEVEPPAMAGSSATLKKHKREEGLTPTLVEKTRVEKKPDVSRAPLEDLSLDQKAHAKNAVQKFQQLMIDVFEAEDQLQPDTSGAISREAQQYFVADSLLDSTSPVLVPDVHARLETAVTAVIESGGYSKMSIEYLQRLQKTCAAALIPVLAFDFKVPDDTTDEIVDHWERKIQVAENSLRASKVLLKLVIAEREDKQLHSEEILQHLLNNVKYILQDCLVPLIEMRTFTGNLEFFKTIPDQAKALVALLQRSGHVLKLLGDLTLKVDISEISLNSLEDLVLRLLFVENAPSEKESLLGIQKFETVRRHGMDVVAKIFLRYPEQRGPIFNDVLSSLEKLPTTRQNARHFKIVDSKPIQLVSALIMLLIQTSAVQADKRDAGRLDATRTMLDDGETSSDDGTAPMKLSGRSRQRLDQNGTQRSDSFSKDDLFINASTLLEAAQSNAAYVARYLVGRAQTATKTGDQPYRNLLDIFVEDFVSVLGLPSWPAAEPLLRALLSHFLGIAGNDKSSAQTKIMALDLMGTMGSGLADLRSYVTKASSNAGTTGTEAERYLARLAENVLQCNAAEIDMLTADGPCQIVLKHFHDSDSNDLPRHSAKRFLLVQWVCNLSAAFEARAQKDEEDHSSSKAKLGGATKWLAEVMEDNDQVLLRIDSADVSPANVRFCYTLTVLNLRYCKAFQTLFNTLLGSLSSPHATVRTRSLKSVMELLERDPSILDQVGGIWKRILQCASDSSPSVRHSALSLIGQCMHLRPAFEFEGCNVLMARTEEPSPLVKKLALKLLKEVYLRNKKVDFRAVIADAMLRCVTDKEETVSELAQQTIEELWFNPFHGIAAAAVSSKEAQHDMQRLASNIISTVQRDSDVFAVLENLLRRVLSDTNRKSDHNKTVSKSLISTMFDDIIDNNGTSSKHSQQDTLQTLTVFAKAYPQLFESDQMTVLRPYIENLSSAEDIVVYRSVVVIYRCVLPVLPPLQQQFLKGVQDVLFKDITKLPKTELLDIAMCLSVIDSVLHNTDRLVKLMISVLTHIDGAKKQDLITHQGRADRVKVKKCMVIAGYIGKCCDFEDHKESFKKALPTCVGDTVSALILNIMCTFSDARQPIDVREVALESMCLICQSYPKNFLSQRLNAQFNQAFKAGEPRLEKAVLTGIKDFYDAEEERSRSGSEIAIGDGAVKGIERLGKSMLLNDNDGATISIAQHYLDDVLRIAQAANDDLALTATEIIASTNRQGLVHPAKTGVALVALGTSPNQRISAIAVKEHASLHQKHESMLEKEYLNAIEKAFKYQRNTVNDISGIDSENNPKLRRFYDVLKNGSLPPRKKLLVNLCARLEFDHVKTSDNDTILHLHFVRFVVENLSLFEYARIDEILNLTDCIEKIFAKTGNRLLQSIEAKLNLPMQPGQEGSSLVQPNAPAPTDASLRQLTAASMVLSLLWETRTYLRRAWGLQSLRDGKTKVTARDVNKAPNKVVSVSVEKHLDRIADIMNAISSEEKLTEQCTAFVDLISVDKEVILEAEGEEADFERLRTPEDIRGDTPVTPGTNGTQNSERGRKRRGSVLASARSTPSKPKKRPSLGSRQALRRQSYAEDEDDEMFD